MHNALRSVLVPLESQRPACNDPARRSVGQEPLARAGSRFAGWARDAVFRRNHRHRLVYNACWEDPALDRSLLQLDSASRLVVITSAGCNVLDYLLDDPAEIHAVDVNPRQTALLELKLALFESGNFDDLQKMFANGSHERADEVLLRLRGRLRPDAAAYWRSKRHYFDPGHFKGSFYFQGSSGDVAWLMRKLVLARSPDLWTDVRALLDARSLEEQQVIFDRIEPRLWNRFTRWLIGRQSTMSLLGVPRAQTRLITDAFPEGMLGFVRAKLRHVATQIPMRDNYFWRVYVDGCYSPGCRPNYLQEQHFDSIRRRSGRVRTYTTSLEGFLRISSGKYSHFVLLDHQDWLAGHDPEGLAEEWTAILRNSRRGTRILFRSAAPRVDYLPPFVLERVRFRPELTDKAHPKDRVGTYGSLHLGEVV